MLDNLQKSGDEQWDELESAVGIMEGTVMDVAFEQGFMTAVKLILSSLA